MTQLLFKSIITECDRNQTNKHKWRNRKRAQNTSVCCVCCQMNPEILVNNQHSTGRFFQNTHTKKGRIIIKRKHYILFNDNYIINRTIHGRLEYPLFINKIIQNFVTGKRLTVLKIKLFTKRLVIDFKLRLNTGFISYEET